MHAVHAPQVEAPGRRPSILPVVLALLLALPATAGCAASAKLASPRLGELPLAATPAPAAPLTQNHFQGDRAGSISEEDLQRVLAAPVFLESGARLGVVQVAAHYDSDSGLPLTGAPATLTAALGGAGLFEVATEISTDWPAEHGVSGLRELAARYRAEYLLLYRHRFVDRSYTNAWGWSYLTLLGVFVAPAETLETAGVLEATLFDVKTGTLLFTVFERVAGDTDATALNGERKLSGLQTRLLDQAAHRLADQVVSRSRQLAALRPQGPAPALAGVRG